jgi:PAS domain S-box-containing protein
MNDPSRITTNLIEEVEALRARVAELESQTADFKHAEDALQESEARYRLFLENFQGIAYRGDMKFTPIFFHGAVKEITGYTEEEFTAGKPRWDQIIHPDDVSAIYDAVEKATTIPVHSGEFEYRIVRKDGQVRWVRELVQTVADESGQSAFAQGAIYDVTERRRAEEALRVKDAAIASSVNAIAVADLESNLTYVNTRFLDMWGYDDSEDVLGKHSVTFWETEDRAWEVVEALREVGGWMGELVALRKDGSRFDVELSASMVTDEAGKPVCMLGSFVDITDRKRAEKALREARDELEKRVEERTAELAGANEELRKEIAERRHAEDALRQSEERFRTIVEMVPSLIVIGDTRGRTLYVGPNCKEITGYTQDELLGRVRWWVHEDDMPRALKAFNRAVRQGIGGRHFEYKAVRKNGELWHASSSWEPLKDENGNVERILLQTIDITERKRAEEALRESEERYRLLVDGSGYPIVVFSVDGVLELINPEGAENLGGIPDDFVGKSMHELFPEKGAFLLERHRRIIESETAMESEDVFDFPSGRQWFWSKLEPIKTSDGKVRAVQIVSHDITERKIAEQRVEASLKEKELLLKEIQHRVKNNLQLISSLFDLEARSTYDERMTSLLRESRNRVRSIALIHEGLYEAEDLTSIDFAEYVKSLATHLFHSYGLGKSDIALKVDVGDIRLSVGVAIPCALIVNELVSNSLKHAFPSDSQGEIRIGLSLDDGNFSLTVGDNGVGLPQGLELRDTASLGLRLVRTLANQLKGAVELDRDAGTTFIITFPRS